MPEQPVELAICVFQTVADLVILVSWLSMFVIAPWYFRSLGKLVVVAKDVDPEAWAGWGCPKSLWELMHRNEPSVRKAVLWCKGINAALECHPVFQLTHRLCWLWIAVMAPIFVLGLAQILLAHLAY